MFRGEKITQAVSAAEGELLGVVTDPIGGLGYLVVAPRTGTFNGTNLITGVYSTATITPSATPIEFVREMVFWRATTSTSQGHWWYQCVNATSENTSRFSYLAANAAGCTATVAPAGGGTSNGFPANGSLVCMGTGEGGTAKNWTNCNNAYTRGNSQIACANATPAAGVSPDGSFVLAIGMPGAGNTCYTGFGFQRVDDQEDGDVDPYVVFASNNSALYSASRTVRTSTTSTAPYNYSTFIAHSLLIVNNSYSNSSWIGFRRRGMASGDTHQEFSGAQLGYETSTGSGAGSFPAQDSPTDPENVATAPVPTRVREPVWIISFQDLRKMRKGTLRWMFGVQGGGESVSYDSLQWIQLGSTLIGYPACNGMVVGPWDGVTAISNG
jgi:hypothetical protein